MAILSIFSITANYSITSPTAGRKTQEFLLAENRNCDNYAQPNHWKVRYALFSCGKSSGVSFDLFISGVTQTPGGVSERHPNKSNNIKNNQSTNFFRGEDGEVIAIIGIF